jgi:TRL-like protein family
MLMNISRIILSVLLLGVICIAISGCLDARMGVSPPPGLLYAYYSAPLAIKAKDMKNMPPLESLKVGTASTNKVDARIGYGALSLGWNDMDLTTAMENGGITKVYYADYEFLSVLGVYIDAQIRVYGE